jgi:hypothetical protein
MTAEEKAKMPEAEAGLFPTLPALSAGGNCIDIPVLFGYPTYIYPRNSKR